MESRIRRRLWFLGGLTAAGLAWRVLVCFVVLPAWEARTATPAFPDDYPGLAHSLLERGTLGYGEGRAAITTARGPGFPAWLAVGIVVGGDDGRWLGLWSGIPILLLGAALADQLLKRHGRAAAIVGYLVTVGHPLPSLVISRVMADELYAACGFGALLLWAGVLRSKERRDGWRATLAAGGLLALHILTRSTGAVTLIVLVTLGLASPSRPRRWGQIGALAGIALIPALAWSVRSSRLEGRPVFVHSLAGYNFWVGEAFDRFGAGWTDPTTWKRSMGLVAEKGGLDASEVPTFHYSRLDPRETAAFESRLAEAARDRIRTDPIGYAARVLRGIPRFWCEAQSRSRTLQYGVSILPVLLLAAVGVWGSRRGLVGSDAPITVASLCIVLSHNLVYAATLPMARMSAQVFPALGWLCGLGAATLAGRTRKTGGE